jgi:hypothetical protein
VAVNFLPMFIATGCILRVCTTTKICMAKGLTLTLDSSNKRGFPLPHTFTTSSQVRPLPHTFTASSHVHNFLAGSPASSHVHRFLTCSPLPRRFARFLTRSPLPHTFWLLHTFSRFLTRLGNHPVYSTPSSVRAGCITCLPASSHVHPLGSPIVAALFITSQRDLTYREQPGGVLTVFSLGSPFVAALQVLNTSLLASGTVCYLPERACLPGAAWNRTDCFPSRFPVCCSTPGRRYKLACEWYHLLPSRAGLPAGSSLESY